MLVLTNNILQCLHPKLCPTKTTVNVTITKLMQDLVCVHFLSDYCKLCTNNCLFDCVPSIKHCIDSTNLTIFGIVYAYHKDKLVLIHMI